MSYLVTNSESSNKLPFKPTYLYIKQHSVTKKLYFGMTVQDPSNYKGSGKHWKSHIKIHGVSHVETLWFCLFYDEESIKEFALLCSKLWNIVDSDVWLNLKEESGCDGNQVGFKHSEETRTKISNSMSGRQKSEKHKNILKGRRRTNKFKERMFIPIVIDGQKFPSCSSAAEYFKVSNTTITNWFRNGKALKI